MGARTAPDALGKLGPSFSDLVEFYSTTPQQFNRRGVAQELPLWRCPPHKVQRPDLGSVLGGVYCLAQVGQVQDLACLVLRFLGAAPSLTIEPSRTACSVAAI